MHYRRLVCRASRSAARRLTRSGTWLGGRANGVRRLVFLSFTALLLYSCFYRALPRKRRYDFIVIHGAGLMGEELTPLLRARVDRTYDLWVAQGRQATFAPSGGQGANEVISEAEAMARYLRSRGVPDSQIVVEDASTTTWENLINSRDLIAGLTEEDSPRSVLVTSDYHVT